MAVESTKGGISQGCDQMMVGLAKVESHGRGLSEGSQQTVAGSTKDGSVSAAGSARHRFYQIGARDTRLEPRLAILGSMHRAGSGGSSSLAAACGMEGREVWTR